MYDETDVAYLHFGRVGRSAGIFTGRASFGGYRYTHSSFVPGFDGGLLYWFFSGDRSFDPGISVIAIIRHLLAQEESIEDLKLALCRRIPQGAA